MLFVCVFCCSFPFFFSLGPSIHLLQKHWFIAMFMIDSVSCQFVVFLTVSCHLCSEYFLLNFVFLLEHNQYSLFFQIYRLELTLLISLKTYYNPTLFQRLVENNCTWSLTVKSLTNFTVWCSVGLQYVCKNPASACQNNPAMCMWLILFELDLLSVNSKLWWLYYLGNIRYAF